MLVDILAKKARSYSTKYCFIWWNYIFKEKDVGSKENSKRKQTNYEKLHNYLTWILIFQEFIQNQFIKQKTAHFSYYF